MDRVFEVLGSLEGAEADRVAVEVVIGVVGHVDTTVVCAEHPMSNFLYFMLSAISCFSSCQTCFPLLG